MAQELENLKDLDLRHPDPAGIQLVLAREQEVELVLQSAIIVDRISNDAEFQTLLSTPKESIPDLVRRLVSMGIDTEDVTAEKSSLERND